jgi:F-box and leucine-rich repeat protein GRR1
LTGVQAFLRHDLEIFCRDAPLGLTKPHHPFVTLRFRSDILLEFTPHQREVFCVFSGQGVIGLRRHLNDETARAAVAGSFDDDDRVNITRDDDDQTMTGMMGATALNGGEEEVDEELEDAEESHNGIDAGGEAQP